MIVYNLLIIFFLLNFNKYLYAYSHDFVKKLMFWNLFHKLNIYEDVPQNVISYDERVNISWKLCNYSNCTYGLGWPEKKPIELTFGFFKKRFKVNTYHHTYYEMSTSQKLFRYFQFLKKLILKLANNYILNFFEC